MTTTSTADKSKAENQPADKPDPDAWKKHVEKEADGDVQKSIAISLTKLADAYQRNLGLK